MNQVPPVIQGNNSWAYRVISSAGVLCRYPWISVSWLGFKSSLWNAAFRHARSESIENWTIIVHHQLLYNSEFFVRAQNLYLLLRINTTVVCSSMARSIAGFVRPMYVVILSLLNVGGVHRSSPHYRVHLVTGPLFILLLAWLIPGMVHLSF